MDWITYSDETDRPGEFRCNLSISNDLTQMVNFLTSIPDCDSRSLALFDFLLSFDTSICSTMVLHPLGILLPQFALTFCEIYNGMPCLSHSL